MGFPSFSSRPTCASSRPIPPVSRTRSQSLSLSDYSPLLLDRDALQSHYRAATSQPSSSSTSLEGTFTGNGNTTISGSHDSQSSDRLSSNIAGPFRLSAVKLNSVESDGSGTSRTGYKGTGNSCANRSTDTWNPPVTPSTPPQVTDYFAGIGAGHSLTPPSSPFHAFPYVPSPCPQSQTKTQLQPHLFLSNHNKGHLSNGDAVRGPVLSPVPGSPSIASDLPPRPVSFQIFTPPITSATSPFIPPHAPVLPQRPGYMNSCTSSEQTHTSASRSLGHSGPIGRGGGLSDSEGDERIRSRSKRRALPDVPTNVPTPIPPEWQPDYKATIPPELIAPSIQYAYSRLSEPPPNLPPRKYNRSYTSRVGNPSSSHSSSSSSTCPYYSSADLDLTQDFPRIRGTNPESSSALSHTESDSGVTTSRPGHSRKRTFSSGVPRLEKLEISDVSQEGEHGVYGRSNMTKINGLSSNTFGGGDGKPFKRAEQGDSKSTTSLTVDGRLCPPPTPPTLQTTTTLHSQPSQSQEADQSVVLDELGQLTTTLPFSGVGTTSKPRPNPEIDVSLASTGKTPIWSTHYIDPCLKSSLMAMPYGITAVANATLSGLSAYPHERFNTTIGAPIDGIAKLAKDWMIPPDGRFVSENGQIELGLAIIDSGGEDCENKKGRKKARVEVISKSGGIKVDIIEVDPNRQLDLRVETKSGDVLILLPDTFNGPIHVTSLHPPIFQPILTLQVQPLANPYANFYTTLIFPRSVTSQPFPPPDLDEHSNLIQARTDSKPRSKSSSGDHRLMQKIEKKVPKILKSQNDYLDMVTAGYSAWSRPEQSKLTVKSGKGRIVIGYRETMDEVGVQELGLKVGIHQDQVVKGKKKWWHL